MENPFRYASHRKKPFQEGKTRISRKQLDRHITKSSSLKKDYKEKMKEMVGKMGTPSRRSISKRELKKGLHTMRKSATDSTTKRYIRKLRSSLF
jgi:hypothetical protein